MVKVIIFDLGGVLFTNGAKKFVEQISEYYQLDKKKVEEVIEGEMGGKYRTDEITRDEFWNYFCKTLGITESFDALEEKWIAGYELIEETKNIIFELSKKYKVYFLSNNVKERVEKLDSIHGFLKWFEDGIFSHEVKLKKPSREIYQLSLAKAGVEPSEAIFIDDKERNLPPAGEIGMQTILFENPVQLKESLKDLKIM